MRWTLLEDSLTGWPLERGGRMWERPVQPAILGEVCVITCVSCVLCRFGYLCSCISLSDLARVVVCVLTNQNRCEGIS